MKLVPIPIESIRRRILVRFERLERGRRICRLGDTDPLYNWVECSGSAHWASAVFSSRLPSPRPRRHYGISKQLTMEPVGAKYNIGGRVMAL